MNRKKVLQVVGGMNIGGTETMLMNLYRRIYKDIQFDFVSYYEKDGYYDKEIKKLGGKVINLEPPNKVGIIRAIRDLMRVIKSEDEYIAVHCHTLFNCGIGVLAAKLSGIQTRVSHAHTTSDSSNTWIRRMYIKLMRVLIRGFSTSFLSCSGVAGEYLFGTKILNDERYMRIPNYINYEKFINYVDKGKSIRSELGIAKDDIVIGQIGRFISAKNHDFLLKIVEDLVQTNPKVKCILVGDGDLRQSIESQIKMLGIEENIYLLGVRDDVDRIFKAMDVFILPSTYEGLGLVLLEAQASGVPCVTSQAIQPEADLRIGLLKKLNLQADIDVWSKSVLKMVNELKPDKTLIRSAFENKGYRIEDITSKLYSVYGIVERFGGELDEEYIDSIL
ncbi:glycosyltransferase family 1 protein [Clostridium sp.]|uniref:glycosyltransferase family 1 protein n=1 Tax=Clostridium sp. TaxID=1506 RepID=UPI00321631DD